MLVPVVSAASTSPSPAKVPPDTESDGEIVVTTDGDTVSDAATFDSVGASLTAMTLTVSVWAVLRLNEDDPSLSTQVTVRVALEPKLVGLSLVELNVTVSSTLW